MEEYTEEAYQEKIKNNNLTNEEALELLYRTPCLKSETVQKPMRDICGKCEHGKQSKCRVYLAYLQLYNYLRKEDKQ